MAESIAHDVVKEALSAGDHPTPSDVNATPYNETSAGNGQATQIPSSSYTADERQDDAVVNDADATVGAGKGLLEESVDSASEAHGSKSHSPVAGLSESAALALALGDASGGSDTDTSRVDAGDGGKDAKGHVRTGSVKKPASFKAVSVTKSFLAKSVSASPVVRPGDKSIPNSPSPASALLSAKPRLVAKSALGGTGKGLAKMNGTSGPDASKVWNKNQPVAPPPPRQFTDEELQTRYGIHMATRLQSDEAGKDSKWADIDDDEDDWAPETVEWMDGTKSNVTATDAPLSLGPQEDQPPVHTNAERPAEPVKPILAAMHKPAISQTTKTILRPGSLLSSSPKPENQKSSLDSSGPGSSKPAQPPSKSPWAVLPPVEKIAPINPPVQQPQRPFQRDPQGFDALPPAPSPAQEIAADDFSRSWRDDRGTKELFNAQSGRYEPANGARRGSRHEHGYRQPAVLQRPSQGGMSNGPAEPSAAFQTSRSAAEGGAPWSRRRASSSLSAAGGRRPSLALSQDHSQAPHSDVALESPRSAFATVDRPGPWVRGAQPPMEPPVVEGEPQVEEPQEPMEDAVAKQQRMMREKIERAKLAKQKAMEAEAAEAAARQERLRIKMAQLAGASASPEVKEDEVKVVPSKPTTISQSKATAVSPPKPPVPQSEGEVAQYGMMKVHQPHPVKKNFVSEASLTAKSNQDANAEYGQTLRGSVSPNKSVTRPTPSQQQPPTTTDKASAKRLTEASATAAAPLDKVAGSWKTSPSPNDYNWGPNTMNARSAVGSSVWGPPLSNEKSLGNGTFESKFSHPNFERRLDNRIDNRFDNGRGGLPAQGPMHGPIGSGIKSAPTPPQRQSHFTQTFQTLNLSEKSSSQDLLPASPSQSPSVDDQAFASTHLDSSLQQSIAQTSSLHPQATAPSASKPSYPSNSNNMSAAQVSLPPAPVLNKGLNSQDRARQWQLHQGGSDHRGWNNFQANEKREKQTDIAKYKQTLATNGEIVQPKPASTGTVTYTVYRDAGHVVDVYAVSILPDGTKTSRRTTSAPMTPNNIAKVRESEAEHPEDHPAKAEQTVTSTSSSRFFPKTTAAQAPVATQESNAPRIVVADNEAPPPAEQGLFDEAAAQPKVKFPVIAKVNLPGMRQPSVALPPRSPGLDKTFSGSMAHAPTGPKHVTMPNLMRADDLKAKFGHLHPGGVFANTKPTFDVTAAGPRGNASTRAPAKGPAKPLFSADSSSDATSKPVAEDLCFDFPDFGSTPTICLPAVPHQNAQFGFSHESNILAQARYSKAVEAQSIPGDDTYLFPTEKGDKFGSKVTIKVTGMKMPKTVDAHIKRRGGSGRGNPGANGSSRKSNTFNPSSRRSSNFPPPKRANQDTKDSNTGERNYGKPRRAAGAAGSPGTSSSSSPKPRGQWTPRGGHNSGAASAN